MPLTGGANATMNSRIWTFPQLRGVRGDPVLRIGKVHTQPTERLHDLHFHSADKPLSKLRRGRRTALGRVEPQRREADHPHPAEASDHTSYAAVIAAESAALPRPAKSTEGIERAIRRPPEVNPPSASRAEKLFECKFAKNVAREIFVGKDRANRSKERTPNCRDHTTHREDS